jgi:outer membrane biogenesis lipoprotein LolB
VKHARSFATLLLLALATPCASCVTFTWSEAHAGRALAEADVAWAVEERPSQSAALARLGAPSRVRDQERSTVELLWVWDRSASFDLGVSVPLGDASASLQGNTANARALGLRLVFDADGNCVEASSGHVLAPGSPALL